MESNTEEINIDIEKNWQRFKEELLQTKRGGVKHLINYLEKETDMKTAPASTKFHLDQAGGLCYHSLNVLDSIREIVKTLPDSTFKDKSLTIVALLHDICKTNFYGTKEVWDKDYKEQTGKWRKTEIIIVNDKFPIGHGEKSVILALGTGLSLTEEEIAAIRWHMVAYDPGIHFNYPSGYSYRRAAQNYPLVKLLAIADQFAELKENLSIKEN